MPPSSCAGCWTRNSGWRPAISQAISARYFRSWCSLKSERAAARAACGRSATGIRIVESRRAPVARRAPSFFLKGGQQKMATVTKRTWEHQGKTKAAWSVRYFDRTGSRRGKTFELKKDADAYRRKVENEVEAGMHIADG